MQSKGRTIFIGDIHGCYDELKALVKKIKVKDEDMVYLVGDLINKGPKSYKVLKFLYKNKDQYKSVLGNHEVGFLRGLSGELDKKLILKDEKKLIKKINKNNAHYLIDYLKSLPLYLETEDFLLIHGGFMYDKKISEHTEEELVNMRIYNGQLWYELYNGSKKIIYGHNAIDGLQIRKNTIGLDSGCAYGKSLSAYILESGEIITQNAFDVYVNVFNKNNGLLKKIKKMFN